MNVRTACCVLMVGACGVDSDDLSEDVLELRSGPRLVEAGTGIQLLEVTSDSYAIYQEGTQVFAASLRHGGDRELIGDVPAGNTAFVYQAGRVAFVWTNPDRTQPGFGVSPLVIWSAASGANLASESSAIGTLATAASPDGELVLFTTGSPAGDNTVGDLVLASSDLRQRRTVAAGIQMAFPTGPCVPRASFVDDRTVAGVSCATGSATATLQLWRRDGDDVALSDALFAPPRLWVDPERGRVATIRAGTQHPIVVDRRGRATTVAEATATNVFFGGDGAALYFAPPAASGLRQAFRARGHEPARPVADLLGTYFLGFGSTALSMPITSPDGRYFLYFDATEATFGQPVNVLRKDVRGDAPAVTLDSGDVNAGFGIPFTEDSAYALYARLDLVTLAVGPMFAAGPRGNRQYSDELGWAWEPAAGSTITFNDRTTLDPNNVFLSTADLRSVDLSRRELSPRLIAEQADVTYFNSHCGHAVAFTIAAGASAGLYVAAVD